MPNLIDATEIFENKIAPHNNLIRYAPQIKQLEAIGKSTMKLPLFAFVDNPFPEDLNRSTFYDWAIEFKEGIDNDFESLQIVIKESKKYFLDHMRISATIIKNL